MKRKMITRVAFMSAFVVLATMHLQMQPMIKPAAISIHDGKKKSGSCPCFGCT